MKKLILLVALAVAGLISTAGLHHGERAITTGEMAPNLAFDTGKGLDLQSLRGRWILLSFWESSDAQSRLAMNEYANAIASMSDHTLQQVSLNFDSTPEMFRELVRRDRLDTVLHYNVSGEQAAKIAKDYKLRLDRGDYGSILIDPQGRVAAINPSKEQLISLTHDSIIYTP